MDAESGSPLPPPQSPQRAGERPAHEGERYGPVTIDRREKEDGRALIVYTREAPQQT